MTTNEELMEEIKKLQNQVKELREKPHRCEVCGKPTDCFIKLLFCRKHYLCETHYYYYMYY